MRYKGIFQSFGNRGQTIRIVIVDLSEIVTQSISGIFLCLLFIIIFLFLSLYQQKGQGKKNQVKVKVKTARSRSKKRTKIKDKSWLQTQLAGSGFTNSHCLISMADIVLWIEGGQCGSSQVLVLVVICIWCIW